MRKSILTAALAAALLLPMQSSFAAGLTVEEIVEKANHTAYYQGDDGKAKVIMTITDTQGRERTRHFVILRKDDGADNGAQKMYVYFRRPADVNKTAFLVWKQAGQPDDRWLYLPALDLVKRIAASDERTSFVGSHFFYEDVSGRSPTEDTHELIKESDQFYVLKSTPKNPQDVEFSYYKSWIHKATSIPIKTQFFDDTDTSYRTYEALKVETIQGHVTIVQSKMTDLNIGGSTLMDYSKVEYDLGLPDEIFSERYLRTTPTKYLR